MGERISGCLCFDQTVAAKQAEETDWGGAGAEASPDAPAGAGSPGQHAPAASAEG